MIILKGSTAEGGGTSSDVYDKGAHRLQQKIPLHHKANHYRMLLVWNCDRGQRTVYLDSGVSLTFCRYLNLSCEQHWKILVYLSHDYCQSIVCENAIFFWQAHLNTCKHDAIPCTNKCGAQIPRVLMEDHLKYTCPQRRARCEFCGKDFTGQTLEVSERRFQNSHDSSYTQGSHFRFQTNHQTSKNPGVVCEKVTF